MANIHRTIELATSADDFWKKIEQPGDINKLLTFLGEVTWDEEKCERTCALGDGRLEELIVDIDPERRRFVYTVQGGPYGFAFHTASMVVEERGPGSALVWDHDFLPADIAPTLAAGVDEAVRVILESDG